MQVVAHHTMEELQQLQRGSKKAAMVLKLRAIILAREGWIAREIAEAVGKSTRAIQQWVGDYNRCGLDGLPDRRGGNHRYLTHEQEQQIKDDLDAATEDPHAGVRYAAELIPYIDQHFGVIYSLSGLYDLLHRLGYEWLMPRPRHEKNDPAVAEAFKKTPRLSWGKWPANTRINPLRAGSKTRHALANKGR